MKDTLEAFRTAYREWMKAEHEVSRAEGVLRRGRENAMRLHAIFSSKQEELLRSLDKDTKS